MDANLKNYFFAVLKIIGVLMMVIIQEVTAQLQPRAPNFQYFERYVNLSC